MRVEPGYERLSGVYQDAIDQAQLTKGKERHANNNSFQNQVMCAVQRLLIGHPCAGLAYQVIKKTIESGRLLEQKGLDAAKAELHGSMNYLGGMDIIYEEIAETTDKEKT